jgi:hypothetical protein
MISKIKEEITNRIGKVIFNFNLIENLIDKIITQHFSITSQQQEFFTTQVLNTSIINFNSKIKILKQILEDIGAEDIKNMTKLLEDLNRYRNMFAHCSIEFEHVFSNEEKNAQIVFGPHYIKPTLKHSMNAQGRVSDKEFFKIYDEFREKTLKVESYLREIYSMM